jgi:hypothetical protein
MVILKGGYKIEVHVTTKTINFFKNKGTIPLKNNNLLSKISELKTQALCDLAIYIKKYVT